MVAGPDVNLLGVIRALPENGTGILCFHSIGRPQLHLDVSAKAFRTFVYEAQASGIELCDVRSLAPDRDSPVDAVPWRIPQAVIDAVHGTFKGKVVCDLGCSRGDAMLMIGRHAAHVIGVERNRQKLDVAWRRGLPVTELDYLKDELPPADVYFSWPDDGVHDRDSRGAHPDLHHSRSHQRGDPPSVRTGSPADIATGEAYRIIRKYLFSRRKGLHG